MIYVYVVLCIKLYTVEIVCTYICLFCAVIHMYVFMWYYCIFMYVEQPIKDVIITVPPFFNMAQRRAIHL